MCGVTDNHLILVLLITVICLTIVSALTFMFVVFAFCCKFMAPTILKQKELKGVIEDRKAKEAAKERAQTGKVEL